MKRATHVSALCALAVALGCASETAEPIASASECVAVGNGPFVQGVRLQGVRLQGVRLQGVRYSGMLSNETGDGATLVSPFPLGLDSSELAVAAGDRIDVELRGGELRAIAESGDELGDEALLGATVRVHAGNAGFVDTTIAGIDRHEGSHAPRYHLEVDGQPLCEDGSGVTLLRGVWDGTGTRLEHYAVEGGPELDVTFSCDGGVLAKCVHWGYAPWEQGQDAHQTCTRLARADYCGDGTSYTQNGTLVDVYDAIGVTAPELEDMPFEAGWGPDGAVCVARPRYELSDASGYAVLPSCWDELPRCDDWDGAVEAGASLGNSSNLQSATVCSR